ncbi:MAG: hypothetical protein Kow00121_45720 [Elainellaceae cyanobacterium]
MIRSVLIETEGEYENLLAALLRCTVKELYDGLRSIPNKAFNHTHLSLNKEDKGARNWCDISL